MAAMALNMALSPATNVTLRRRPAPVVAKASVSRIVAMSTSTETAEEPSTTVFPAEACDILGGEFCGQEGVGPEVPPPPPTKAEKSDGGIFSWFAKKDVETVDYAAEKKTVFPGEACETLGGEFCEPDFQEGVGPEKKL